MQSGTGSRLFDGLFHLADLLLDLTGYYFADPFAFQTGIIRQLAHLLLNLALHFVNRAGDPIFSAWLHLLPPRNDLNSGVRAFMKSSTLCRLVERPYLREYRLATLREKKVPTGVLLCNLPHSLSRL
jgi:hypothetical protein